MRAVEDDPEQRRKHRLEHMSIRRYRLGSEPDDDLSDSTTASERLAMMWPLARRAWELTGKPFPEYRRETMPGRVIRGGS